MTARLCNKLFASQISLIFNCQRTLYDLITTQSPDPGPICRALPTGNGFRPARLCHITQFAFVVILNEVKNLIITGC